MWQPLLAAFQSRTPVICLVPDLPGHGRSADRAYRSHGDTLARLIPLIENRGPVTVVGFSLGAQLAVLLASERPDLVNAAVIVSAQAKPSRLPRATLALLGLTAPLARNERFARAQARQLLIPDELLPHYLQNSRELGRESLLAAVNENIRFTVPAGWRGYRGRSEERRVGEQGKPRRGR